MIRNTTYPNFQKGGLLKSDDLNEIINAFRSDDQGIRQLVGYGIVQGLEIVEINGNVTIKSGIAVTPDGELLFLENEYTLTDIKENQDDYCIFITKDVEKDNPLETSNIADNCGCEPQQFSSKRERKYLGKIGVEAKKESTNCTIAPICIGRWSSYSLKITAEIFTKNTTDIVELYQKTADCYPTCFEKNVFGNLEKNITQVLDKQAITDICKAQYLYDYLKDLIAAQEEFLHYAPKKIRQDNLDKVYLGKIGGGKKCDDCREPFYHYENDEKARFYACRMMELIQDGAFKILDNPLRITPSAALSVPLSERAIPFYLTDAIRPFWNYELSQKGREGVISYYEDNASNPLKCDLTKYDFFRVEGYCGMELKTVVKQLVDLKSALNIAFDIKIVAINENLTNGLSTYYEDLQRHYAVLRQQYLCQWKVPFGDDFPSPPIPDLPLLLANYTSQAIDCRAWAFEILKNDLKKRREDLIFSTFKTKHTGLEHFAGVPNGGTLVLVVEPISSIPSNSDNKAMAVSNPVKMQYKVIADFALPYRCCDSDGVVDCLLEEPIVLGEISGNQGNNLSIIVTGNNIYSEWRTDGKPIVINANTIERNQNSDFSFGAMGYCNEMQMAEKKIQNPEEILRSKTPNPSAPQENFKVIFKEAVDALTNEEDASIVRKFNNILNKETFDNLGDIEKTIKKSANILTLWKPVKDFIMSKLLTMEDQNKADKINAQLKSIDAKIGKS